MIERKAKPVCGDCKYFEENHPSTQFWLVNGDRGNKGMCRIIERPAFTKDTPDLVAFSYKEFSNHFPPGTLLRLNMLKCYEPKSPQSEEEIPDKTQ